MLSTILKNNQKSVCSNIFWYVQLYIFRKVKALYIEIKQMLKKSFGQNKLYKKWTLFLFREL